MTSLRTTAPAPVPAGLFALLVAAGACGGDQASGNGGANAASPVEAAVARTDTLALTVRAVGSLEADARVEVKPETSGRVTSIAFREGQEVRRGQVLVRLDEGKLEAQLEAARAALTRARAEAENLRTQLRRNDSLVARGAISQQAYDDVRTSYNTAAARMEEARANVRLAEQRLEDAVIRSPFDGRIGAREFDLGDYLAVGDPLFTVVDDDPMEIQFAVPERYLGSLERGTPVDLTVRSTTDRTFRGVVDFVSPYVDRANRTVALKARVPNPASELRAGQFADVQLQLERRSAVIVPEAAVIPRQEGNSVFLVRGDEATRSAVEVGERLRGIVEILSGVSAGDTVVVAGQHNLAEGAAVEVTMTNPATAPAGAVEVDASAPPGDGGSGPDGGSGTATATGG